MSNPIFGKQIWEILVPANDAGGNQYSFVFHRLWDKMVREVTGGVDVHSMNPVGRQYMQMAIDKHYGRVKR